jgi:hypothetical protein
MSRADWSHQNEEPLSQFPHVKYKFFNLQRADEHESGQWMAVPIHPRVADSSAIVTLKGYQEIIPLKYYQD